ncbi:MAG: hypothetical protein ACREB9_00435 [Thermoplasmata archaeon]
MSAASPRPAPTGRRERRPLSRVWLIGLGLLLSFVGLAFLAELVPSGTPSATVYVAIALTFLGLWVGGILLGRSRAAP